MNNGDKFSFLPWVRNELTQQAGITTGSLRPTVSVTISLSVSGGANADAVRSVAVHGPGDVIGLQPEAVLKTTPPVGEQVYPALSLVSIEFGEEDLPWRYSPQEVFTGDPNKKKVNPWCFLLVLKTTEFEALPQRSGPLPVIKVLNVATVFPEASTRWAWAHVQVNGELGTSGVFTATDVQNFLKGDLKENPDLAFSRVFSPRQLEANTVYHAFLVPSYETGRLAGLGLPFPTGVTADRCAWTRPFAYTQSPAHELLASAFPVYYQWEFRSGEAEDFEVLARRLQPSSLQDFGTLPLALTTPLSSAGANAAAATQYQLQLPGIIQRMGAPAMQAPLPVAQDLYATLQPTVTRRASGRPIVTPPVYGRAYASNASAPLRNPTAAISATWLNQVNLHPGYRGMAGIGSRIIQDNQEEYMQRAWEQVRDIIVANMNLRGMQSGLETTASARQQHLPLINDASASPSAFRSTAPGSSDDSSGAPAAQNRQPAEASGSDDETFVAETSLADGSAAVAGPGGGSVGLENYGLHLAGLSFTRLRDPETELTLLETVRQSDAPLAAFSPTFRRLLKPFGRYQAGFAGRPQRPTLPPQAPGTAPNYAPTLLEKNQNLKQRDTLLSLLVAGTITAASPKYPFILGYQFNDGSIPEYKAGSIQTVLNNKEKPSKFWVYDAKGVHQAISEGEQYQKFLTAFTSFSNTVFAPEPEKPRPLNLALVKQVVIAGTQPEPVFLARANRAIRFLPHYGAGSVSTGKSATPMMAARGTTTTTTTAAAATPAGPLTRVQPVMAYPAFKEPMGPVLQQRYPELFLPNVGDFPANGVALLERNRAFIEAYMLGLNHAFGSELLWRNYPTDVRGSYFRQFWDVSEARLINPPDPATPEKLAEQEEEFRDIAPIDTWGANALGENPPATSPLAPTLILAVRADLLKRYPNTVVCAAPGVPGTAPSTTAAPDLSDVRYPVSRSTLGQDIVLFAFELTQEEARGNLTPISPAVIDYGFFFVFHERPGELQFGLDLGTTPTAPSPGPSTLSTWDDLTWSDFVLTAGTNIRFDRLTGTTTSPVDAFASIASSADFAYAVFQKPFLIALHASSLMGPA